MRAQMLGPGKGLSGAMVRLFAIAAGLSVANIYYAQPLLAAIARTFGVGVGAASLIATFTTAGYAVGLAFLVPLGDIRDRRGLVTILLLVTAGMLAVSAAAPSFGVLAAASAVLAVTAVAGPILVPFAATLARDEQRGAVTGTVMSGVLVGVLLARTAGGLIAGIGGWRAVYAVAAVLTIGLAVALWRALPKIAPAQSLGYGSLLASAVELARTEPVLRLRSAFGFLGFATFSVFWTSIAFLLTRPPYSLGEATIGLFALVGAAGATAARIAGKLTDRGGDQAATGVLLALLVASWAVIAFHGGRDLPVLIAGVVLLDLAVQGAHVTNLSVIYRLRPEARSRLTTVYMTSVFLGGMAGSAASGAALAAGGWIDVALTGAAFAATALGLWIAQTIIEHRHSHKHTISCAHATAQS
jgi:predicted MFS family arabinose efflux permease